MQENLSIKTPVLITGDSRLVSSVAVCLMLSQQPVVVLTNRSKEVFESIEAYDADLRHRASPLDMQLLHLVNQPSTAFEYSSAIILTNESMAAKKTLITQVEGLMAPGKAIAVNTESILLSELQKRARYPERILGVNWVEPAHTTYFLELIGNINTDEQVLRDFADHAKNNWKKDPYIIRADQGIRSRLMCALIREAFYLVENGYVSYEDIDRACRNDAGYYLPFAGNFRYIDLMGTYIYGVVMKDMNPDLTRQQHVPAFFNTMILEDKLGMEHQHGFYDYTEGEAEKWQTLTRNFSYQVRDIIEKYHNVI